MRAAAPLLLVAALAVAGCSTMTMNTDWDRGADFSAYKTFSTKEASKPRNPVARRSAEYAIGMALEGRGLKQVDDGGDLSVFGHFVVDQQVRFDTWGYGMVGWNGYAWGAPGVTTVTVIPEGTIVIDLVDAKTKSLVWRGVVKDEIDRDLYPEEREKKAIEIAKKLFADFPPKPKGK